MNKAVSIFFSVVFLLYVGCGKSADKKNSDSSEISKSTKTDMKLSCLAFKEGMDIPVQFTCEGDNISPGLIISDIPDYCQSLALICDDPDAPRGTWVHWVIYNIPPEIALLPEKIDDGLNPILSRDSSLMAIHGKNDFGRFNYGGPCPPPGSYHRYFFKLYALDIKLDLKPEEIEKGLTADMLRQKMNGHILAEVSTMGRFKR